jgi:ATP synthase protein I
LRHLPSGLAASGVLLVAGVALFGVLRGAAGAAGFAAGVALVAASYVLSSLAVAWADTVNPRLVMPVGLTTYVTKVILIGIVMAAIAATGWAGLVPMGCAVIATAVGWIAAQAWWTWRARILYVEVDR